MARRNERVAKVAKVCEHFFVMWCRADETLFGAVGAALASDWTIAICPKLVDWGTSAASQKTVYLSHGEIEYQSAPRQSSNPYPVEGFICRLRRYTKDRNQCL